MELKNFKIMKEIEYYGTKELVLNELLKTKGGVPILVVLGVITTAVSVGKTLDQMGEWFLKGWNNPQ